LVVEKEEETRNVDERENLDQMVRVRLSSKRSGPASLSTMAAQSFRDVGEYVDTTEGETRGETHSSPLTAME